MQCFKVSFKVFNDMDTAEVVTRISVFSMSKKFQCVFEISVYNCSGIFQKNRQGLREYRDLI